MPDGLRQVPVLPPRLLACRGTLEGWRCAHEAASTDILDKKDRRYVGYLVIATIIDYLVFMIHLYTRLLAINIKL